MALYSQVEEPLQNFFNSTGEIRDIPDSVDSAYPTVDIRENPEVDGLWFGYSEWSKDGKCQGYTVTEIFRNNNCMTLWIQDSDNRDRWTKIHCIEFHAYTHGH
jgi:hypothetical protein